MTQTYKTIILEEKEDIALLTLNRPEKRNSLNPQLISELHEIFSKYKVNNEIFALMITGAGSAFCAGADLAYLQSLRDKTYDEHLEDSCRLKDLYYLIYTIPFPVIALVNGPALAGGCGLTTVCDFVISTESAVYGYPEVKIGFNAAIVSVFLRRIIGLNKSKKLLLSGERIDARQALELGLVTYIVNEDDLIKTGFDLIEQLKANSPSSMKITKQLLLDEETVQKELEKACIVNARSRMLADFKEGIDAFLQRRKAKWGSEEK
jgi:methylglutaconyl-CoA hydratase